MDAEILADSVNAATGDRITTFILPRFPKILAQELLTHRIFSRNSASSRAIPIDKVIENILADPYIPTFTRNIKGMQGVPDLSPAEISNAEAIWLKSMHETIDNVEDLLNIVGVHKQEANRLLEPFMRIPIIITATDFRNFFEIRTQNDVQPDFRDTAREMLTLFKESAPKKLEVGQWHLPFVSYYPPAQIKDVLKISTARSARISYLNHYGMMDLESDYSLHERLLENKHYSPFEHSAKALPESTPCRNFEGWMQYRVHVEEGVAV